MEVLERLLNVALIVATLRTTAPILLVALGGSFTTKAGIFNIGLEGQMLVGAFFAVIGSILPGSPWLGVLCGVAAAMVFAYIFAAAGRHLQGQRGRGRPGLEHPGRRHDDLADEGDLRHARLDLRPGHRRLAGGAAALSRANCSVRGPA